MNQIRENDKIEIEKMLKSHLNPALGGNLMNSLAHSWQQAGIEEGIEEGRKKEKITMAKEMKKEGLSLETIMTQ